MADGRTTRFKRTSRRTHTTREEVTSRLESNKQSRASEPRESDIRRALLHRLREEFPPGTANLHVEELGLCQGFSRIDVAVINGRLHGYEIKSAQDTLQRLPVQQTAYNRVFDFLTIVTSRQHLARIKSAVPSWWGIDEAIAHSGTVTFLQLRAPRRNPRVMPLAIAQLLWRDEALSLLASRGLAPHVQSTTRRVLWELLATHLQLSELSRAVRETLRARRSWRAD